MQGELMKEMGCRESHISNRDNEIRVMHLDRYNKMKMNQKYENLNKFSTYKKVCFQLAILQLTAYLLGAQKIKWHKEI